MRDFVLTISILGLMTIPAIGQDRPNLSGSWQLDPSKSEFHNARVDNATWVIKEDGDSIHITEMEKSKTSEVKCTVDGKDCKITGESKGTTSFWYNGPMLVEFETRGDRVTRYRMTLSDDGKTLKVEATSIVPKGDQNDVLIFAKQG